MRRDKDGKGIFRCLRLQPLLGQRQPAFPNLKVMLKAVGFLRKPITNFQTPNRYSIKKPQENVIASH
jgi:hypothetical protein